MGKQPTFLSSGSRLGESGRHSEKLADPAPCQDQIDKVMRTKAIQLQSAAKTMLCVRRRRADTSPRFRGL